MKIGIKLTLFLLLFVFLPLSISTSFSEFFLEKTIIDSQVENLESVASVLESRIADDLQRSHERLRGVTSRTQLRLSLREYLTTGNEEALQKVEKILNDARNSLVEFRSIALVDQQGNYITSVGNSHRNFYSPFENGQDFYLDSQEHIVTFFNGDVPYVYLSGPLVIEGEILGIVIIETLPERQIVEDYTGLGQTGEVLLAQHQKNGEAIFLHKRRFETVTSFPVQPRKIEGIDLPIEFALEGKEEVFLDIYDYRNEEVFAVTRFLEEENIGLVAKIDKAEVLAPIKSLRITFILFSTAILLISIPFVVLVSRSIAKPLHDIITLVRKINSGMLEVDVSDKLKSYKDEIGELARSLSGIIASLKLFVAETSSSQDKEGKPVRKGGGNKSE